MYHVYTKRNGHGEVIPLPVDTEIRRAICNNLRAVAEAALAQDEIQQWLAVLEMYHYPRPELVTDPYNPERERQAAITALRLRAAALLLLGLSDG